MAKVDGLVAASVSLSTHRTYRAGQQAYFAFCRRHHFQAVPATVDVLSMFVAYLLDEKRRLATVRVYLAGVRHLHLTNSLPVTVFQAERLAAVMAGARRLDSLRTSSGSRRRPATVEHLQALKSRLFREATLPAQDRLMLWAAITLGYFGFLRGSEYTAAGVRRFVRGQTLLRQHVKVGQKTLTVVIPSSKTDQLRNGFTLAIGRSSSSVCAVSAMEAYLAGRPAKAHEPLLVFTNGDYLTLHDLNAWLKRLSSNALTSHCLRIGATTAAAKAGIPEWKLRQCGRWRSSAYLTYIRTDATCMTDVAPRIGRM